jgi:hypothetical protein
MASDGATTAPAAVVVRYRGPSRGEQLELRKWCIEQASRCGEIAGAGGPLERAQRILDWVRGLSADGTDDG